MRGEDRELDKAKLYVRPSGAVDVQVTKWRLPELARLLRSFAAQGPGPYISHERTEDGTVVAYFTIDPRKEPPQLVKENEMLKRRLTVMQKTFEETEGELQRYFKKYGPI